MSKKLFEKRKKEICVGALGVVLLAGVGVSIGVMSNGVNDSNKTSVVDKVDKEKDTDEKDKLVDNNVVENTDGSESVEVTPEENSADGTTSSNGVGSEDKETSSSAGTSNSESKPSSGTDSKPSSGGGSSNSKPSSGGSTSNSGSSSNSKPSTGGSSSNSKPSTGGSSNSGGTSKPEAHTHNWVAVTEQVHHDEQGHWEEYVVTPAWTEEVPVYEERELSICNGCGKDITNDPWGHIEEQMLQGNMSCGGYHSQWQQIQVGTNKVEHPAVMDKKWVVDKAAWTETVTTGHKCSSCGSTK